MSCREDDPWNDLFWGCGGFVLGVVVCAVGAMIGWLWK